METSATNPVTAPANSAARADSSSQSDSGSDGVISSDFDTFLVMLTAQIQNQDPLNPIDSTDYAVQLATFSGVEQQVLTNDLLESMTLGGNGLEALSQLAGWVGMDAQVPGQATLSGAGVALSFATPASMKSGEIVIRDSAGGLVTKLAVTPGQTDVFWDGTNTSGNKVADGTYSVSLQGLDQDSEAASADVYSYVRVIEARMGAAGPELLLGDGRLVEPDTVRALREGV